LEHIRDYDYDLPEAAIAQEPLDDRSASKLLWLHKDTGDIEHRTFRHVVDILEPGDLLVLNNTRVTAFRIFGQKITGAAVEILAIKALSFFTFECLVKPAKKLPVGAEIKFEEQLRAWVEADLGEGKKLLRFGGECDLAIALPAQIKIPLPPYIHHAIDDPERYQTVYAKAPGSAAAPTAGLHFTPSILQALQKKGVKIAWVTLDVGIDTFRPVQVDDPADHLIHGEICEMPEETANAIEKCTGRIIAVGTTSVRTLESFATAYRKVEIGRQNTKLFIRPGYKFKIIDGMFTNFHMPRTSMLMMISALAGREAVMNAYREALRSEYRFLSFGDSMFIA
jgi:S-adenosylmethionine:tRNA ribosyltransferase-isomerase